MLVVFQTLLVPSDCEGPVGGVCLAIPYDAIKTDPRRLAAVHKLCRADGATCAVCVSQVSVDCEWGLLHA